MAISLHTSVTIDLGFFFDVMIYTAARNGALQPVLAVHTKY